MNKKCTAPSCRKTFSTLEFNGRCPHCGKAYPQLLSSRKQGRFWSVRITERPDRYVRFIKCVRIFFGLGLKEAKNACDAWQSSAFVLERAEAVRFIRALEGEECAYEVSRGTSYKKAGIFYSSSQDTRDISH